MTLASELYCDFAATVTASGTLDTSVIGAKSLSESYGSLLYSVGLITRLLVCPITSV